MIYFIYSYFRDDEYKQNGSYHLLTKYLFDLMKLVKSLGFAVQREFLLIASCSVLFWEFSLFSFLLKK